MKILVISLLRLGDVAMCTPVLKGLRVTNPQAKIDLLINAEFSKLTKLMPMVDDVYEFDRELMQTGLGERNRSVFESYDRLEDLIDALNEESYDLVLNLTHNRLSGWLTALIQAKECLGLQYSPLGAPIFGSEWFRYLNQFALEKEIKGFHFSDIFYFASGLKDKPREITLVETPAGREEAKALLGDTHDFWMVQPLTSEAKKTWSTKKLFESIELTHSFHPKFTVLLLGAPSERESIQKLSKLLSEKKISNKIAISSLEGAFSLLKKSKLLLTGDTSIKHLASAAMTPIVEISLGSSEFRRTGAYSDGSIIVQSKEHCAPCGHGGDCFRETHACSDRIPSELVGLLCAKILAKDFSNFSTIASDYTDEVSVMRVANSTLGYWTVCGVSMNLTEETVASQLDQMSWKLLLQKDDRLKIGEFGTEGLKLANLLSQNFPEHESSEWADIFQMIERDLDRLDARLQIFLSDFKEVLKHLSEEDRYKKFLVQLEQFTESIDDSVALKSFGVALSCILRASQICDFSSVRRVREGLSEARQRLNIEMKLIRSMKQQITEKL